jgi:hypothetical protein
MQTNILLHLKNRLQRHGLRNQLIRAKSLTPIIDAVNEAAVLEGVSPEEIVNDYVTGKEIHAVISNALVNSPPPRPGKKLLDVFNKARDRRQGPLAITEWKLQHLIAEQSAAAQAELNRRGYIKGANGIFTKTK